VRRIPLGVLQEREFRLFFTGQMVSLLGDAVTPFALAWAVLDLTGSARDLGFVIAAKTAPLVVFLQGGQRAPGQVTGGATSSRHDHPATNHSQLAEPDQAVKVEPNGAVIARPVLHADDAVANKVCALFGRAKVRDHVDVDAIVASGRYTEDELLDLAADHDPGFDRS